MYAIIEASGAQHKITTGEILHISRDTTDDEKTITFDRVLFIGGEGTPKIGTPTIAGATVTAEIVREMKGPKIDIVKYKRRKGYHKKQGHRQPLVELKITAINV